MTDLRITALDNGLERTLLSVIKKKSGDIYVIIKSGTVFRDHGLLQSSEAISEFHNIEFQEDRISIHPTSDKSYNTIKLQTRVAGNLTANIHWKTNCLKSRSGFLSIYAMQRSLGPERHHLIPSDSVEKITLYNYNREKNCLFYGLGICHKDYEFDIMHIEDIGASSFVVNDVRFLILNSFLNSPSHHAGSKLLIHETDNFGNTVETNGIDLGNFMQQFRFNRNLLFNNYLDLIVMHEENGINFADLILKKKKFTANPD
jgi:hypothetical protein